MRINEIFYSLQGEGHFTGYPAVFVRFSGCNLKCPFCDTDFDEYEEVSEEEIVDEVVRIGNKCRFVVLTGGEPTLQVTETLVMKLQEKEYYVAIETNGTRNIPRGIDWVTISPKEPYVGMAGRLSVKTCDELKIVFDGEHEPNDFEVLAMHYFLQPCDTGDEKRNEEIKQKCVEYIKENPRWRMSLQTQKILNVR